MSKLLKINEIDNVAVELDESSSTRRGHKVALKDIQKGEYIFKYGQIIGKAKVDIKEGEWVHSHNVISHLDESVSYSYNPVSYEANKLTGTFLGYKRKHGRAGIRNDIYIIPTDGCVNGVVKDIEKLEDNYENLKGEDAKFSTAIINLDSEIEEVKTSLKLNGDNANINGRWNTIKYISSEATPITIKDKDENEVQVIPWNALKSVNVFISGNIT